MDRYIIHDSGNDNTTKDGTITQQSDIMDIIIYSAFADTKDNKMVIMDIGKNQMTFGSEYIDHCYFGIDNENNCMEDLENGEDEVVNDREGSVKLDKEIDDEVCGILCNGMIIMHRKGEKDIL